MVSARILPLLVGPLVTLLATTASALDATSADDLATSILSQLGRSKGVCAVPNCGDGQLALSFLQKSSMKVHAMDGSMTGVLAAAQLMSAAGFAAPQTYASKGTLSQMPYVDRFVDCIVATNLTDADLAGVSYSEIQRALCPSGMAWIGRATSEGAGITQSALQNWINAADKKWSTATVSTTGGTWAVITRRELTGVDVWPRHNYDVNGTRYSKDSVYSFPWLPQAKIKPYNHPYNSGGTVASSGGRMYMVAVDNMTNGSNATWLRAYNIYNGELLWSRDCTVEGLGNLNADPIIAYGPDIYLNKSGSFLQLNGLTGAQIGTVSTVPTYPQSSLAMPPNGTSGCRPYSASIWGTFLNSTVLGWDFKANTQRSYHFYKPPCGLMGQAVSNGFLINPAPTCGCGSSRVRGTHLDGPAGTFQFDRDAAVDGSDRLERGQAYGAVSAQVTPDNLDWPTHRCTSSRSGRSAVSVAATATAPAMRYNCAPAINYVTSRTTMRSDFQPEREPTPPVVAGDYTLFGGSDGYVRCVDNRQGRLAWSYPTGGRIYAAPAISSGCVYAGSGDGYVYCLEAHTGRLVWRFRAAPLDMRMNLFGYLSSLWPVMTGVLVSGGNAYFAAGMQTEYGASLYCVNATTGALVWQNNRTALWMNGPDRLGFTPCGYITMVRNRLVAANSVGAIASFDPATGVRDPMPAYLQNDNLLKNGYPPRGMSKGREVGVVANSILVTGGSDIFRDHSARYLDGGEQMYIGFNRINANGTPVYPKTAFHSLITVTPTWDDNDYFTCMYQGTRRLVRWAVSDLGTRIDAKVSESVALGGESQQLNLDYQPNMGGTSSLTASASWWPTQTWSRTDIWVNALVSAPNALIVTYAKADPLIAEDVSWYLGALNRATGTTIWETALPDIPGGLKGEPLFQGLAIDRNGSIIVTQRNGNVLCYGGGTVGVASGRAYEPVSPSVSAMASRTTSESSAGGKASGGHPSQMSPEAPGQQVAALTPTVALPHATVAQPVYDAVSDSTDMVNAGGVRVHSLSPVERSQRALHEPRDMTWHPAYPCLAVVSVKASSSTRGCMPQATVDRTLSSRWSPSGSGAQSITYDLGVVREVGAASVVSYASEAMAAAFTLEVSLDGRSFVQVDAGTISSRGTGTMLRTFLPIEARYVQVTLSVMDGSRFGVYEVGLHGVQAEQTAAARAAEAPQ